MPFPRTALASISRFHSEFYLDVYGPRPIATGWLDQDRWSQLLTYIRLRDVAGQRLRREP
jgi:hypothetical protein